jgi:hypothetical protein
MTKMPDLNCDVCKGWGFKFIKAGIPNIVEPCPKCNPKNDLGKESKQKCIKSDSCATKRNNKKCIDDCVWRIKK